MHLVRAPACSLRPAPGALLWLSSVDTLAPAAPICKYYKEGSIDPQHISDTRDGAEPARLLGVIADLLTQAVHQLLEQLPIAAAAMPPYMHQQPLGVHHLADVGQQQVQ